MSWFSVKYSLLSATENASLAHGDKSDKSHKVYTYTKIRKIFKWSSHFQDMLTLMDTVTEWVSQTKVTAKHYTFYWSAQLHEIMFRITLISSPRARIESSGYTKIWKIVKWSSHFQDMLALMDTVTEWVSQTKVTAKHYTFYWSAQLHEIMFRITLISSPRARIESSGYTKIWKIVKWSSHFQDMLALMDTVTEWVSQNKG